VENAAAIFCAHLTARQKLKAAGHVSSTTPSLRNYNRVPPGPIRFHQTEASDSAALQRFAR